MNLKFKFHDLRQTALNQRGMTLIEIMIVIAIIAGLMAVLGTTANDKLQKSRQSQSKIAIKQLATALENYNLDCNSYPTTEQGFNALVTSPGADACPNWGPNPYIKNIKEAKDAWTKPFFYESDGASFVIRSLGRDGKEGGTGYDLDLSSED